MSRRIFDLSCPILLLILATQAQAQSDSAIRTFNLDLQGGCTGSLNDEVKTCRDVRIWSDAIEISAAIAESKKLDVNQGEWRLLDEVQVVIDTVRLSADSAVFVFEAAELIAFELVGSPAVLTDFNEARGVALSFSAERIEYNSTDETARLTGDVVFASEGDEIRTSAITYSLRDQSYETEGARISLSKPVSEGETQPETRDPP